uniref:G-protein coupled receptors family 1 profile domain-containing protein n=1 Tax=Meloidogyne floridensis TaxID=298350 RepID=A0A915NXN4_9BILA
MEILNSFSPLNLTQKHQETSIDIFETPHISFVTTLINGAAEAMNYLDENITNGLCFSTNNRKFSNDFHVFDDFLPFSCWEFYCHSCYPTVYNKTYNESKILITASAYTLAAIALERYYAICRPLQSRIWHTRTHAKFMISLVWLASIIVNLFMLFMYEERKFNTNGLNCSPKFKPLVHFSYQIYMTVMLLVIPLVAMTVLYGSVIRTLSSGIFVDLASKEIVDKTENLENRQQNLSNSKWYKRPSLEGGCSKGSRLSLVAMIKNELKLGLREPTIATSCLRQNRTSNGQVVEVNLRSTQAEKSAIAKKRNI